MMRDDRNRPRESRLFRGDVLPILEHVLKMGRRWFHRFLKNTNRGGSGLKVVFAALVLWLLSGTFIVLPDEQGVVLRFGALARTAQPGLNYHLPWPIESAYTPSVTRENQINIGYRLATTGVAASIPDESLSLTDDENIVDINFTVYWMIEDAGAFLFNVRNPVDRPEATIKAVAETAMREVVGKSEIEPILTTNRESMQNEVRMLMGAILASYDAGVRVTRVQMQKADPPAQVLNAYRDVQAARTDQDRMRNEAEAYAKRALPEARGGAARIVQEAEGYKQQVIALAAGEARRFISIHDEYKKAPEVTRRRIYIETMQSIFSQIDKVILDTNSGPGVVPYLPLPQLRRGPTLPAPALADTTEPTAQPRERGGVAGP